MQLGPLAVLAGEAATSAGAGLYMAVGLPGLLAAGAAGTGAAAYRMTRPGRGTSRAGGPSLAAAGRSRAARTSRASALPTLPGGGAARRRAGRTGAGVGLPKLGGSPAGRRRAGSGGGRAGAVPGMGRRVAGLGRVRLPHRPGATTSAPGARRAGRLAARAGRGIGRVIRRAARPGLRRRWIRRAVATLLAAAALGVRAGWRRLRRPDRDDIDGDGGVADTVADPANDNENEGQGDGDVPELVVVPGDPPPPAADLAARRIPTTTGGTGMFTPAALIEEALAKAAAYDPEDMWQFVDDLGALPEMVMNFGKIFTTLGEKVENDLPAATTVAELLYAIARVTAAVTVAAEEAEPGARRILETDLARRDAPRGDERKWNV
ncbi:hypothetical protein [Frankia sp. CcI49]|uniref:hypothetical protein n=1 Tax=Frankia sp. CcI49 TaxID=1745382 RepID=UPI001056B386|nr:hypothetical protein [Frankia sp. CcI49]